MPDPLKDVTFVPAPDGPHIWSCKTPLPVGETPEIPTEALRFPSAELLRSWLAPDVWVVDLRITRVERRDLSGGPPFEWGWSVRLLCCRNGVSDSRTAHFVTDGIKNVEPVRWVRNTLRDVLPRDWMRDKLD